jgi:hypothetical protein
MQYWATLQGEEFVNEVKKKVEAYDRYIESVGRLNRIKQNWRYLNGLVEGADGLKKTGKAGEIVKISINNYRAFLNNIHVLLTQAKSYFECQAENMDVKSQSECVLGKAIVSYYIDHAGLGASFSRAVFDALCFGDVFLEGDWDESLGSDITANPEDHSIVKTGDVCIKAHNTLNVIRDIHLKSHSKCRWLIVRDHDDKYELAATYPEHAEYILEQQVESRRNKDSIYDALRNVYGDDGDTIEIFRVYHKDTKACVGGLDCLIIGDRVISAAPITQRYEEIPVKRLAVADIEGSFLAYSPMWDLIPICQASDFLTTAQITNAINLAFTNIWSQDPNLKVSQLSSGMGLINSQTKPEALNLAHSSPELEKGQAMLHSKAQFLTGINSVAAGQPEAVSNIKSGNGLALILSTAVQFQSAFQERYADFRSDLTTLLIKILQKNASAPMLIGITGRANLRETKRFKSDDILSIKRVKCSLTSPIMATIGGRMQVADNLVEKFPGQVSVQAYVSILQTGLLDHIESGFFNEQMAIISENEAIGAGKQKGVLLLENHPLHIKEHLKLVYAPDAKDDPQLIDSVMQHIMEHFAQWGSMTPSMLQVVGIPAMIQPQPMMNPGMDAPPVQNTGDGGKNPMLQPEPNMPSMPNLPKAAPEQSFAAYDQVDQLPATMQ